MVKLKSNNEPNTIMAKDLEDGQIAVIIEDFSNYNGRVIKKYGDNLVTIGMSSGQGWCNGDSVTLLVRVLENGETLIVTNNQ